MRGNRWEEIAAEYRGSILSGAIKRGERLPTESQMAEKRGISRMTAHRVMQELQDEGLVERKRRAGTIVSPRRQLRKVAVMMPGTRLNPQAAYLQGIAESLGDAHDVLFFDTRGSAEREAALLATLLERADGAIVFPTAAPDNTPLLGRLAQAMPLVCIDRLPDGLEADAVVADEFESSREGLRLLVERGHRRIAHLTSDSFHVSSVRGRLDGYLSTLADVGGAEPRWLRTLNGDGLAFGEFARRIQDELEALMRPSEPPTAVFCLHDDYLAATLAACGAMGLQVPDDLDVLSVNDSPGIPLLGIESVHRIVPQSAEIGRLAGLRLIEVAQRHGEPPQTLRVRSQIVPGRGEDIA